MKKNNFLDFYTSFYFIGIGGISMSALAEFLFLKGKKVGGSDINKSNITKKLENMGIKVNYSHDKNNVKGYDVIVYSSSITKENQELSFSLNNGYKVIKRSELLGCVLTLFKNSVCVSGSHGKTTTTAMISSVLSEANFNPTVFLGGEDKNGNFVLGEDKICLAEACEYQSNFLNLFPKIAVVLNIDDDHLDCYGNLDNEINAFNTFIKNRISLINADDINSKKLDNKTAFTFGIKNKSCYSAKNVVKRGDCYSFSFYSFNRRRGRINLKVMGKHNVYNALACLAVCDILKIDFIKAKKGLESFSGVKRRNEYIGNINGIKCFADYCHHPREIKETLKTFNDKKEKLLVVFQPHTYSRTKILFDKFTSVLSSPYKLIIYKTYPAREKFDEKGDAFTLYGKLEEKRENIFYAVDQNELIIKVNSNAIGVDKILFLGAGDIYEIAKNLIRKI